MLTQFTRLALLAVWFLAACSPGGSSSEIRQRRPVQARLPAFLDDAMPSLPKVDRWVTADFNGDGKSDVISEQFIGATLLLQCNGSLVDYSAQLPKSDFARYNTRFATGDFDGDGDIDILNVTWGNVHFWTNDGQASFARSSSRFPQDQARFPKLVDFDGDGDLDAFIGRLYGQGDMVYRNRGDGTFGDAWFRFGPGQTRDAILRDFNGDGFVDYLHVAESGYVTMWFADSKQKLTLANTPRFFSTKPTAFAADLDRDGDLDVILSGLGVRGKPDTAIWTNTNGTMTVRPFGHLVAFVHDVDGINGSDLLAKVDGALEWWLNDGRGNFAPTTAFESLGGGLRIDVSADFDSDGDLDLLGSSLLLAVERHFEAAFSAPRLPKLLGSPRVIDVDGDGHLDLVDNSSTTICWNNGMGSFSPQRLSYVNRILSSSQADLDGDGDLDLFFAGRGDTTELICFVQIAPRKFVFKSLVKLPPNSSASPGSSSERIAAFDFEGDGDADLLHSTASGTSAFVNDGGAFRKADILPPHPKGTVHAFHVADINGDSYLDVFSTTDTNATLWLGGQKRFSPSKHALPKTPSLLTSAALFDIDNDGDIDIVAGSYRGQAQGWLSTMVNDGQGKLTLEQRLPAAFNPVHHLTAFDFDEDGDVDIAAATNKRMRWYRNGGNGRFSEYAGRSLPCRSSRLATGDLDGDGDIDLIARDKGRWRLVESLQRSLAAPNAARRDTRWILNLAVNPAASGSDRFVLPYISDRLMVAPRAESFGFWFLEPAAISLGTRELPVNGRLRWLVDLPPALEGKNVYAQAIVTHAAGVREPRYTNAVGAALK